MHCALWHDFVLGKLLMSPPSSTLHICVLQLALATLSNPGTVAQGGRGPACRGGRSGVLFHLFLLRQEGFIHFFFAQTKIVLERLLMVSPVGRDKYMYA